MKPASAWVAGTDTVIVYANEGNAGTKTIPYAPTGTLTIPIRLVASLGNSVPYAGDPYGMGAVVIKEAIKYQQELCKVTTAGFSAFESSDLWSTSQKYLTRRQAPLEVTFDSPNSPANIGTLFSKIWIKAAGELPLSKSQAGTAALATHWKDPLLWAKEVLSAKAGYIKTSKQAIVMISDGLPNDWGSVLPLINGDPVFSPGKMPPVFGIQLGRDVDGNLLRKLADTTGGKYFVVPPGNTDSLRRVMAQVLGSIVKSTVPKSITVTNQTLNPPQVSRTTTPDFHRNPDGGWAIGLDSIVALRNGINAINFEGIYYQTETNKDTVIKFQFYLNTVAGQGSSNEGKVTCYEPSQLQIFDKNGHAVQYLTWRDTAFTVRLKTASSDLGSSVNPPRMVSGAGDLEFIPLTFERVDTIRTGITPYALFTYSARFPLRSSDNSAIKNNSLAETKKIDDISMSWSHPRDFRDTAFVSIAIEDPAVERPIAVPGDTNFFKNLGVTLSCPTAGAAIEYCIGAGCKPSLKYADGDTVKLTQSSIIRAVASIAGYRPSDTAIFSYAKYFPSLPPVIANPADTVFVKTISVRLSCANTEAAILYCFGENCTPSQQYSGNALLIDSAATLRASAQLADYAPSAVTTSRYIRNYLRATAVGAEYRDINADGIVDQIVFNLDPADAANLDIAALRRNSDILLLPAKLRIDSLRLENGAIIVDLKENQFMPQTSGSIIIDESAGSIPEDGILKAGTIPVLDRVAPAILSAKYIPEKSTDGHERSGTADTLIVIFSESAFLVNDAPSPFLLIGRTGSPAYSFTVIQITTDGTVTRFLVKQINGTNYPTNGDLVWINPGMIADLEKNVQNAPDNQKAPMAVTYPPYKFFITAGPNPFIPGVTPISSSIKAKAPGLSESHGVIVVLDPKPALALDLFNPVASATIYDATGNIVLKDKKMIRENGSSRLLMAWDGRNLSGRYAGSGTYLAVIKTSDTNKAESIVNVKIAVKR